MATMTLERLGDLRVSDRNPRVIMRDEYRQLVGMIEADPGFLEARPILAMEDGTIYAGHMRYRVVKDLYRRGWRSPWGPDLVPAIRSPISEAVAMARGIRDNTHAGDWQELELAAALAEIAAEAGVGVLPTLGLPEADLLNALAGAGIGEAVDPLSGRPVPWDAPERPGAAPGGLRGARVGSGSTPGSGGALTVVLRFGTERARSLACDRLLAGEMLRSLGATELASYDEDGRLVLSVPG